MIAHGSMQPTASSSTPANSKVPLALLGPAVLLVVLAMVVAFGKARGDVSYALGAAIGQLVIITLLASVFRPFKRFRPRAAFTKVVIWVSAFVLLVSLISPPT